MSESSMRSAFIAKMKSEDACAIESPMTNLGIPDVNLKQGWMEFKWMEKWPKTCWIKPVKFKHTLSKEQGIWLYRRSRAGGLALCVCQVEQEWFFFDGLTIKDRFDQMNRTEMELEALLHFPRGLEVERLKEWLNKRN